MPAPTSHFNQGSAVYCDTLDYQTRNGYTRLSLSGVHASCVTVTDVLCDVHQVPPRFPKLHDMWFAL